MDWKCMGNLIVKLVIQMIGGTRGNFFKADCNNTPCSLMVP